MVNLEAIRADVVALLTAADIKAVDYIGETMTPPVAAVIPGDPYLDTEGAVFGHANVNLLVLLIGGKGTNKAAASQIDSLIAKAIDALDDWDITEVAQPGQVNLNGSNYLGSVITISTETKL